MIPAWSLTSPARGTRNAAVRGADGAARHGTLGVGQQRAQAPADGGERHAQRGVLDHQAPDDVDAPGPRPVGTGTSPCTTSVTVPTGSPAS